MKGMLYRHLLLIMITTVLVIICYHWVDKAVVYYAVNHHLPDYRLLHHIQRLPELFIVLVPLGYLILLIRWHYGYGNYHDKFALSIMTALLITVAFTDELKFIFGRYWPNTYVEDNLSLLRNGAYGFNWFHSGKGYRSFPSGHTATIFAAMTVVGWFYPKMRFLAIIVCSLVILGLIGMHYHFVSDIIAGACLGTLIGDAVSRISLSERGIGEAPSPSSGLGPPSPASRRRQQ